MLSTVLPVFLVILVGYLVGRRMSFDAQAEKLINHYVLFVALPCLLFLPIAKAEPADLANWPFTWATLLGIAGAYGFGWVLARKQGIQAPRSALVGMASCYGTTGFMGVPILLATFGEQAAVPAAIATVLHNVPAIMAVIITHDLCQETKGSRWAVIGRAGGTVLRNPLVVAVLAGACFSLLGVPVPEPVEHFARFLGAAAGPTALFALGLGLSRLQFGQEAIRAHATQVFPVMGIKLLIQPLLTLLLLLAFGSQSSDIWFITALVMAAQPIGAGAYVFARQYDYFGTASSIAILLSLLVGVFSLSALLSWLAS